MLLSGNQKDGRGNIAPETIVLPIIAMLAKRKCKNHPEDLVEVFIDMLKKQLVACREELIWRFNWINAQEPACAEFMWTNHTMKGFEQGHGIVTATRHGTLAIGQLGLAETLQILIGTDHTTKEGMELGKRIEQLYKDFCANSKETYRYLEISENQLLNKMIKNLENREGRKLSDSEVKELEKYCKEKYSGLTPADKLSHTY